MRKRNKTIAKVVAAIISLAVILMYSLLFITPVNAHEQQPTLMRVTCYYGGEVTKSGQKPRKGICAGAEQWLGYLAVVYDSDMNFIGYWEVLDTGSHERLTSGSSIDIWQPDLESCNEWISTYGDYCYVQLIDAEG